MKAKDLITSSNIKSKEVTRRSNQSERDVLPYFASTGRALGSIGKSSQPFEAEFYLLGRSDTAEVAHGENSEPDIHHLSR